MPGKLSRVGIKTFAVVHGNTSQRLPVMCTSDLTSRSNAKVLDFHSGPNTINCTGFKAANDTIVHSFSEKISFLPDLCISHHKKPISNQLFSIRQKFECPQTFCSTDLILISTSCFFFIIKR